MEKKSRPRRTLQERAQDIFDFINRQDKVFPKSRLKEIGLSARASENWFKLIEYIQKQPQIRIIQSENNVLIEKIEGKYQALMRKKILDDSIPFEQRIQHNTDYLKSLYFREKTQGSIALSRDFTEISQDLFDAVKILYRIDPNFSDEIKMIESCETIQDLGEKEAESGKLYKLITTDESFGNKFNKFLEKGIPYKKILDIQKNDADYREKLDQAVKKIRNAR